MWRPPGSRGPNRDSWDEGDRPVRDERTVLDSPPLRQFHPRTCREPATALLLPQTPITWLVLQACKHWIFPPEWEVNSSDLALQRSSQDSGNSSDTNAKPVTKHWRRVTRSTENQRTGHSTRVRLAESFPVLALEKAPERWNCPGSTENQRSCRRPLVLGSGPFFSV